MKKFGFRCTSCGFVTESFSQWFQNVQKYLKCGDVYSETFYNVNIDYEFLFSNSNIKNIWHYFDLLPLNYKSSIITYGEGGLPIDRWEKLEKVAYDYFNIDCNIRVLRYDNQK